MLAYLSYLPTDDFHVCMCYLLINTYIIILISMVNIEINNELT